MGRPQDEDRDRSTNRARANGRAICSGCGQQAPGYDRLAERRFEFVPLWQITVYFVYATCRLQRHVEGVPESDCQEGFSGDSRARPISHHAKDATYR